MTTGGRGLLVVEPGALLTVQDLGRPGLAALGVPESGALDQPALRLANRLVGNPEGAAGLEATLGAVVLQARGAVTIAVTGAPTPVRVDGRPQGPGVAIRVPDGARVELGHPVTGSRTYLAVRGGLLAPGYLGSASTDLLSGLGAPLEPGSSLAVGPAPTTPVPALDHVVTSGLTSSTASLRLRIVLGPRDNRFTPETVALLTSTAWWVGSRSNRIGVRLEGGLLACSDPTALPSEGAVAGAIQVAANGVPTLLLADHPVTGGYPVIAVVVTADLAAAGQAAPGTEVRLHRVAGPDLSA